jgi:hypothetical protein
LIAVCASASILAVPFTALPFAGVRVAPLTVRSAAFSVRAGMACVTLMSMTVLPVNVRFAASGVT